MRLTVILIAVLFLAAACQPEYSECTKDSDCVPADCCHSTSCVSAEDSPYCFGIFCSQECIPGTMDCAQGECRCSNGKCTVVMD